MFRIILLCLLTCCSSFMPLKQSESIVSEDHTQVVEKKTKRDYVKTSSGYYHFAATDLFSVDFLEGLLSYYVNDLGVSDMTPNNSNPVNDYVIQTSGIYEMWYYHNNTGTYDRAFYVSNIVMKKYVNTSYGGGSSFPYIIYDFKIANSSPYDKIVQLSFEAQRTHENRLTIWGIHLDISNALINQFGSLNTWYANLMLSELAGGYNAFIGNIWNSIHSDPYNEGYNKGFDNGLQNGREVGERIGYQTGYSEGEVAGYTTGYNTGVSDTIASGSEAMTIFAGIMDVAFIPVNVFFLMFNYEVFGINIAGFVSGLLTIAIVIILMRFIFGRKV